MNTHQRTQTFEIRRAVQGGEGKQLKWPHKSVPGEIMANCGFISIPTSESEDNVQCCFCNVQHGGFEPDQESSLKESTKRVLETHLEESPTCLLSLLRHCTLCKDYSDFFSQSKITASDFQKLQEWTFAESDIPKDIKKELINAGFLSYIPLLVNAKGKNSIRTGKQQQVFCIYCDKIFDFSKNYSKITKNPYVYHSKNSPNCHYLTHFVNENIKKPGESDTNSVLSDSGSGVSEHEFSQIYNSQIIELETSQKLANLEQPSSSDESVNNEDHTQKKTVSILKDIENIPTPPKPESPKKKRKLLTGSLAIPLDEDDIDDILSNNDHSQEKVISLAMLGRLDSSKNQNNQRQKKTQKPQIKVNFFKHINSPKKNRLLDTDESNTTDYSNNSKSIVFDNKKQKPTAPSSPDRSMKLKLGAIPLSDEDLSSSSSSASSSDIEEHKKEMEIHQDIPFLSKPNVVDLNLERSDSSQLDSPDNSPLKSTSRINSKTPAMLDNIELPPQFDDLTGSGFSSDSDSDSEGLDMVDKQGAEFLNELQQSLRSINSEVGGAQPSSPMMPSIAGKDNNKVVLKASSFSNTSPFQKQSNAKNATNGESDHDVSMSSELDSPQHNLSASGREDSNFSPVGEKMTYYPSDPDYEVSVQTPDHKKRTIPQLNSVNLDKDSEIETPLGANQSNAIIDTGVLIEEDISPVKMTATIDLDSSPLKSTKYPKRGINATLKNLARSIPLNEDAVQEQESPIKSSNMPSLKTVSETNKPVSKIKKQILKKNQDSNTKTFDLQSRELLKEYMSELLRYINKYDASLDNDKRGELHYFVHHIPEKELEMPFNEWIELKHSEVVKEVLELHNEKVSKLAKKFESLKQTVGNLSNKDEAKLLEIAKNLGLDV